jgi:hypothetical protein
MDHAGIIFIDKHNISGIELPFYCFGPMRLLTLPLGATGAMEKLNLERS